MKDTSTSIKLSEQQDYIIQNIQSMLDKQKFVSISGPPGVGKTTIAVYLSNCLSDVQIVAPTHKACQVLIKKNLAAKTFHSTFNASVDYDEDGSIKFKFPNKLDPSSQYIIYIIDESSMITYDMFQYLLLWNVRVIFLGDKCQLPPIYTPKDLKKYTNTVDFEKESSPVYYRLDVDFSMDKNFRNDIPIFLEKLNFMRNIILNERNEFSHQFIFCDRIKHCTFNDFLNETDEDSILLSYRTGKNNVVGYYNVNIRNYLFDFPKEPFCESEKMLFTDFYSVPTFDVVENKNIFDYNKQYVEEGFGVLESGITFYSQDNIKVESVVIEDFFDIYTKDIYSVYKLTVRDKDNGVLIFRKVHIRHKAKWIRNYKSVENALKKESKKLNNATKTRRWKEFHFFKKTVDCPLDYAYCLSIHKSQGSEFKNVYIDLNDFIFFKRINNLHFWKCLYVAISRSKENVYILNQSYFGLLEEGILE